MAKFYVIAGATRFVIKEVEADSRGQAEEIAYRTDPEEWEKSVMSDNYEHMETIYKNQESWYVHNIEEALNECAT